MFLTQDSKAWNKLHFKKISFGVHKPLIRVQNFDTFSLLSKPERKKFLPQGSRGFRAGGGQIDPPPQLFKLPSQLTVAVGA